MHLHEAKHTLHAGGLAPPACLAHAVLHQQTAVQQKLSCAQTQTLGSVRLHLPWARLALSDLPVLRLTEVMVMVWCLPNLGVVERRVLLVTCVALKARAGPEPPSSFMSAGPEYSDDAETQLLSMDYADSVSEL